MKKLFRSLVGSIQIYPVMAAIAFGVISFILLSIIVPTGNLIHAQVSSGVTLAINPAMVNTTMGQNFTVNLDINTANDQVSAAEIHLTFDPTKVQVTGITAGTILPVILIPASFNNTAGTATITLGAQPTLPASGLGTLALVNFRAVGSGNSTIAYASTTQTASVGKTGNTLTSMSSSTVSVAAPVTPTPVPTPSRLHPRFRCKFLELRK